MSRIAIIYKYLFARKFFYPLHRLMFSLSTRGLGILNYENSTISGEKFFLKTIASNQWNSFICIDVGANVGNYSCAVKNLIDSASLYAIEPHPTTFLELEKNSHSFGYYAFNLAFSERNSLVNIFDYTSSNASDNFSTHASLYKDAFPQKYGKDIRQYQVKAITLDQFLMDREIEHVNLLKIDVEGHEFKVLLGAREALRLNKIDLIQFEFNSMNRSSRVYMKDFFELLNNYKIYRLMQDFLAPIQIENTLISELFAYQNIVAIREGASLIF